MSDPQASLVGPDAAGKLNLNLPGLFLTSNTIV
jgi:hypothetical protein